MRPRTWSFGFRASVGSLISSVFAAVVAPGWAAESARLPETNTVQIESRNSPPESPTPGLEGRIEIVLPGSLLEARSVEHKAKLILRVAETRPRGNEIWYDLRYIGMVPGRYDLRGYLTRADGSSTNDLPPIPVTVASLLPEKHNGQLLEPPASRWGRLSGYRALMIAAGVLWAVLIVPLVWRKRRKPLPSAPLVREPTLADRLRPLVEQAAHGALSRDGQAQLERLLLSYWRHKLNLEGLSMVEAVARLRQHPEAGELLRALESWLHRPPGSAPVNVSGMLEPYKNLAEGDPSAALLMNSR